MKVDGVFAGGGVKALAFAGALEALMSKGIEFERVAGTSAGALTAAFIKAGFTSGDIQTLFRDVQMKNFLDPRPIGAVFPFLRWIYVYRRMGVYKGDAFENWLAETLAQKGVKTFNDLPEGSLKIVTSDISNGTFMVVPDDLPRYGLSERTFSVARAVRMSCSLPFFFEPVTLKNSEGEKSLIVDGGVLSNFPIWLFMRKGQTKRKRPVLGLKLSPEYSDLPARNITNGLSYLHAIFDTMRTAHDQRYISKVHAENIIFIPVKGVTSTSFDMSEAERNELIKLGRETALSFLSDWSY